MHKQAIASIQITEG